MLRLSRMTDYGAVLLARLAEDRRGMVRTAPDLARMTGLPEPTVGKLLKTMAREGLVTSHRGARGGYALARRPEAISMGEIIAALEGPVALALCVDGTAGACGVEESCPIRGRWDPVNDALRDVLDNISLAHVAARTPGSVRASRPPRRSRRPDRRSTGQVDTATARQMRELEERGYKYGFVTDIETDTAPKGLNEDVIRFISAKKDEPAWLLDWRLKSYRHWRGMKEPRWANVRYPPIDYQDAHYYSAPKGRTGPASLDDVDPKLRETYEKLGIPLSEQEMLAGVAVDAVFDSVSVATTYKGKLEEMGIVFCSMTEAVHNHPELVRKYLGSVVPYSDNFFATLNSAVFTDGSFVYIPPGVRCPMELSTYFRINAANTGQFERTLIVADTASQVSYLEGCTAPMRDEHQLHAAVVELIAMDDAQVKYSTVQNWYPGDEDGKGGVYNFVTKRGTCRGRNARISWTQVETGSAITWKYPSCVLQGENSVGEFYSVAITNHRQQADTGTKMIHIGPNTRSRIVSKGISAGRAEQTYRGLVRFGARANGARNFTQCDSLLIGAECGAHTVPYIENRCQSGHAEHEATTSRIDEDQLFYCRQRGLSQEEAVALIVNGFCREVLQSLPMEFAVEAQRLVGISLEGSVG